MHIYRHTLLMNHVKDWVTGLSFGAFAQSKLNLSIKDNENHWERTPGSGRLFCILFREGTFHIWKKIDVASKDKMYALNYSSLLWPFSIQQLQKILTDQGEKIFFLSIVFFISSFLSYVEGLNKTWSSKMKSQKKSLNREILLYFLFEKVYFILDEICKTRKENDSPKLK